MKKLVLTSMIALSVCAITFTSCKKKISGCTDSKSLNYNPDATEDDGSCTYYEITSADFPSAGAIFVMENDTSIENKTIEAGGEDKVWDYSYVVADAPTDTTFYISPSSIDIHPNFSPASNLCVKYSANSYNIAYYSVTSDKVEIEEQSVVRDLDTMLWEMQDKQLIYNFPVKYNSSFTDNAEFSFVYKKLSGPDTLFAKDEIKATTNFIADGKGKVTTPNGTYNCIRFFTTTAVTYKQYVDPTWTGNNWTETSSTDFTTYIYSYYSKEEKTSVCDVSTDSSGKIILIRYLK